MPDVSSTAVTIYHNPNCGSSKNALAALRSKGVDLEVVEYLKNPPDRATLERIVAALEDPVGDLVRKDSLFDKLGLDASEYTEPEPVIELLLDHKALMQRPVIVKGGRAIIGRPTSRVTELLAD
jgi:arsenate reductase